MIKRSLMSDVFSRNITKDQADKERLKLLTLSQNISADEEKYNIIGKCPVCDDNLWINNKTGKKNYEYYESTGLICNECMRKKFAKKHVTYSERAKKMWKQRRENE